MADNYLEKKMEEHRQSQRRVSPYRSPSGNKPNTAIMPCALRGAFIIGGESLSEALKACAAALRSTSCRTAFCCTDRKSGNTMSQSLGLQYYPVDNCDDETVNSTIKKAQEAFGAIDVVVKEINGSVSVDIMGLRSTISADADCTDMVFAKAAAGTLLYLALPQSKDLGISGNYIIDANGRLSVIED